MTSPRQLFRSPGAAAFTLLEVLVSAAVLSIVLAVMFSALSTSMNLWRNTDNKIIADREARAVVSMLARDLSSVVVPAHTNHRPRLITNAGAVFLQFLTTSPAEYQSGASNVGDICYVEYTFVTNAPGRELRRMFYGSRQAHDEIIRSNFLRGGLRGTGLTTNTNFQSLGLNLLPTNTMAARGIGSLSTETKMDVNFRLIGPDQLQFNPPANRSNYPVAIEVNFAVADPETMANTNVIAQTNVILRNAGLYSFRIPLPKPPDAP